MICIDPILIANPNLYFRLTADPWRQVSNIAQIQPCRQQVKQIINAFNPKYLKPQL